MTPTESRPAVSEVELSFLELFELHRPRLLGMLRRRMDDGLIGGLDAEDILSETFLHARRGWDSRPCFGAANVYLWFYRAARDCLSEAWRRDRRACRDVRRTMAWPEASSAQLALGLVGTGTSPSNAAARSELHQRMQQVLAKLKEVDREVLWMRHFDKLTHAEAGQVLQISESAATVRYVRALRRLRESWRLLCGDLEIQL